MHPSSVGFRRGRLSDAVTYGIIPLSFPARKSRIWFLHGSRQKKTVHGILRAAIGGQSLNLHPHLLPAPFRSDSQRRLGCTVVYVTHDMMEAMTLADRMTVLCDGEVVLSDTPEKVYESGDEVVRSLFGN